MDKEASWLKKAGKYRYDNKKYYLTENEGYVLGVMTTKASTDKIANLEEVLFRGSFGNFQFIQEH